MPRSERALAGWTVELYQNNQLSQSVQTDANGAYRITGVALDLAGHQDQIEHNGHDRGGKKAHHDAGGDKRPQDCRQHHNERLRQNRNADADDNSRARGKRVGVCLWHTPEHADSLHAQHRNRDQQQSADDRAWNRGDHRADLGTQT